MRWHVLASRPYLRFAILVTIAVTLSYWLGTLMPHASGLIAAVTAATVIQPTLHNSLREVFWQMLGVALGVLLALTAAATVGFSPLVLAAAVFTGFVFCRLCRLPESSAIGVVVPTVLIIAGNAFSVDSIEARILGVLLGGTIGALLSLIVRPGSPTDRVLHSAVEEAGQVADIVDAIAESLPDRKVSAFDTGKWLDDISAINVRLADLRDEAEDALKGSRWSPILSREEAANVLVQVKLTQETARTVTGIVRDLRLVQADHDTNPLPFPLADSLSDVLAGTASIIADQAATAATGKPAETLAEDVQSVLTAENARRFSAEKVKASEQTMPLMLGGSLLRDSEKIETLLADKTHPKDPPSGEKPSSI